MSISVSFHQYFQIQIWISKFVFDPLVSVEMIGIENIFKTVEQKFITKSK